jgi:hypothetical protein
LIHASLRRDIVAKHVWGGALVLAALVAFPSSASANETRCVGQLIGTFDNIVVPENTACNLFASTIRRNVRALRGSSLSASLNEIAGNLEALRGSSLSLGGNQIAGNIEAKAPRWVGSQGDRIGGNFTVSGATGPGLSFQPLSLNVFVCGTTVTDGNILVRKSRNGTVAVGSSIPICPGNDVPKGNILVRENDIPAPEAMAVDRNTVGGNVQVFSNRGDGPKAVMDNVVGQNLQCKHNDEPFVGGPNLTHKAEGQCF